MIKDEKEADQKFKEAKEYITKSIFRWSKDYTSAASSFSQALKLYKSNGSHQKVLKTLQQLIICNEKQNDDWAVGRNYESMLETLISQKSQDWNKLKDKCRNGFIKFRMSDSLDKGLSLVSMVANYMIKNGQLQSGVQLLASAYVTVEEEKSYKKRQVFNQIALIYVQNSMYAQAEGLYEKEIKNRVGKDCQQLGLIVILLILIQHQPSRANSKLYQLGDIISGFLSTDEAEVADQLIKAYQKAQPQHFKKLTTRAVINVIFPIVIIRKIREINIIPNKNIDIKQQNNLYKDHLL